MKGFLIIATVLAALVLCDATPRGLGAKIECFRNAQARIYEDRIKELIEGLRDQLKAGIPDKNIPPLDPFVMDNWNLKIKEDFARLNWNMTGSIAGFMSFEITKVTFSLAGFKFTFEITFPQIPGKGSYSIDGSVLEVLPVYGTGEFDVFATNLVIGGSGALGSIGTGEEQSLYLKDFQMYGSLENFVFGVTGLMGDDNLNKLISEMISDSLPDLIQSFQSQINQVVSAKVTELADSVLVNLTINDILEALKPKPSEYEKIIHCGDY